MADTKTPSGGSDSAHFQPDSSLLANLIHSLPFNVYAKDREGRFIFANSFYCENVGKKPADILGRTDFEIHPSELARKYLEDDKRIMESGRKETIEEKWQAIDGTADTYIQVLKTPLYDSPHNLEIIGTIGIFWDITERKQMEIALAEERNLLRTLIDNLPDMIYVKDTESRIVIANRGQTKALGRTEEQEVIGRTDFDFYPREAAQQYYDDEKRLFIDGEPVVDKEEIRPAQDGEEHWTLTTKIPLRNTSGQIVGLVGIGHDITRRKEEERQRLQLEAQLQQARKMESVGTLTAGIAHDFNNLLSVINGYTELLQMTIDADSPHQKTLGMVLQAGRSAADLVRQLLAFSRRQIARPQVVDLNAIITAIQPMLQRVIGENIEIILALKPDLWTVRIDPAQFEQIVLNLAANARDAMPFGGTLTMATAHAELDEQYARRCSDVLPGRYVVFSVSDNGVGIDREIQEHIFEPFYTTKEKNRGTGLGLATVFGIVKQNRGHIWLTSEPGIGSTFDLYFPLAGEDAQPDLLPREHAAAEMPSGHEHILVVEDQPALQDLARTILENLGYTVATAASGRDALLLAETLKTPPDLLLTDVIMPGMSGRVLADQLGRKHPGLKVLYMSGYTDDAIVHYGILEPDIEFIHKPFTPSGLANKIRSLLDSRE
jgi:PAS domain S-box-containing protein